MYKSRIKSNFFLYINFTNLRIRVKFIPCLVCTNLSLIEQNSLVVKYKTFTHNHIIINTDWRVLSLTNCDQRVNESGYR